MLSCCLVTVLTAGLSAIALGVSSSASYRKELAKTAPGVQWNEILSPANGMIISAIGTGIVILYVASVIGLWKSRKWAIWTMLIMNFLPAVIAIALRSYELNLGSLVTIVIAIYCVLRLTGTTGPKL